MILVYLCLAILFCGTNCVSVNNSLVINRISRFPISINQPFEVSIKPVDKKVQFGSSFPGPIVIQIVDETGSDNEVAVLEFDLKEPVERDFQGEYIRIQSWERNTEKRTINITLYFTKRSFNQTIEIYHINASSIKERRNMLNDLKLAENLYRSKITKDNLTNIDLYLKYRNVRVAEYYAYYEYDVVCRSLYETEPFFEFDNKNRPYDITYNKTDNSKRYTLSLRRSSHLTNITCRTGNSSQTIVLKVSHRPSRVYVNNTDDKILEKGSNVLCKAQDGYPEPKVQWNFIRGPKNAHSYFKLSQDNQTIYFSKTVPSGSTWSFKCTSTNRIKGKKETYDQYERFTIRREDKIGNITEEILQLRRQIIRQDVNIASLNITEIKRKVDYQKRKLTIAEESIEKLKKENREQNQKIVKLTKQLENVEKTVKNLSKKQEDPKVTMKKKMVVTSSPQKKPNVSLKWSVDEIAKLRRKRKLVRSKKYYSNKISFPLRIWLWFNEEESLRISLHMSKIEKVMANHVTKGSVTMSITNSNNPMGTKTIMLPFQRGRQATNLDFFFKYTELEQSHVLKSDGIDIMCSVTVF